MQTSRKLSLAEVEEPLRIVVVYEDTAACVRAGHIHDYLVAHLGRGMRLEFSWWPFDLLQEAVHSESGDAASEADLVIFSAQPGNEWPSAVISWVASWTRLRAGRPGAIAAIFSPSISHSHGLCLCGRQTTLHALAKCAGMDFLPHEEHSRSPNFAQADEFIKRVAPVAPMIQNVGDRPDSSPYWGING